MPSITPLWQHLFFRPTERIDDVHQANRPGGTETAIGMQSKSSLKKGGDGDKNIMIPLASFWTWKKLPKRLNLWVFKFDPADPTDLSFSDRGGFPRPELLPIADIFRSVGGND